uniref:Uncharacterized protein n=1 Tax=Anguilla anguilla TaxID=7936 RepID=A0A0E9PJ19_ANGAN
MGYWGGASSARVRHLELIYRKDLRCGTHIASSCCCSIYFSNPSLVYIHRSLFMHKSCVFFLFAKYLTKN